MSSRLLSPTDCKFCLTAVNLQRFKFPCDCLIYAHPDCYIEYSETRERVDGRWKLTCPQCKLQFNLPDHTSLQINILQDDDEHRPITRREARSERCKICTILSVQGILLVGMVTFLVWGYTKIFTGGFR